MSRAEWRALDWVEQRILIEGMNDEFAEQTPGQGQTRNTVTDSVIFDNRPGEFAALGIRERTL